MVQSKRIHALDSKSPELNSINEIKRSHRSQAGKLIPGRIN